VKAMTISKTKPAPKVRDHAALRRLASEHPEIQASIDAMLKRHGRHLISLEELQRELDSALGSRSLSDVLEEVRED